VLPVSNEPRHLLWTRPKGKPAISTSASKSMADAFLLTTRPEKRADQK
jgi:hypothetical protein